MIEKTFIVQNKLGLHARPAALFVKTTHRFECDVQVYKEDQEVDGKSIMGILTLAAEQGSELRIVADGSDEEALMKAISDLFANHFEEDQDE